VPASLQLFARPGHPTFLDLPWDQPLAEWQSDRVVQVVRGISRHVVRFVDYDGRLYALKELPRRYAEREYRLLRDLEEDEMPVVEVVGLVTERGGDLDAVLITRHLEYSIPYRALFSEGTPDELRATLISALSELLVRLHLAGFFWGDCSLSNTLFRRDAGALSAYLVDAETGELHTSLTSGQREYDVMLAEENIAGELMDVTAESGGQIDGIDPFVTAAELRTGYEDLWLELTREEVFRADESYRIEERLRRLNELGFDVDELELDAVPEGFRMRLDPHVVEPGHHRRKLALLTGLTAQENQARRMLNDLYAYRALLEAQEGKPIPESVAAYRWRAEVFEPAVNAVPPELHGRKQAAEIYHEILQHRWYMSEQQSTDAGLMAAVRSYIHDVLKDAPDERVRVDHSSSYSDSDAT
jgi:tRNA A-37 threonylcarbamoyl transferase component Bud32